jgi:hypothetical protein
MGLSGACSTCDTARRFGNQGHTKFRVSEPGDQYEREADRKADAVMRMPDPAYQGKNAPLSMISQTAAASTWVVETPPAVHEVLSSPGQPLAPATRDFFEQRFGHDFSRVRIHVDDRAAVSARSLGALAYTAGDNVVFGRGQYVPGSTSGRRLLAHELTHAMQQGGRAASSGFLQRQPESETPEFPDFPGLLDALELNVGKNLRENAHHLYRASILHPDEPGLLQDTFMRYGLGLNVLKTSYRFAGFEQGTADKLAVGTGILFKGLTFVQEGEFTLDFQVDVGKGLKLETNLDLAVDPDNVTQVRKAGVQFGLLGHF